MLTANDATTLTLKVAQHGNQARNIAKTAAARVLLTQVFYALRDGHARSAGRPAA
jgi:hypothetical protein